MSIITGKRLNYFYEKAVKPIKESVTALKPTASFSNNSNSTPAAAYLTSALKASLECPRKPIALVGYSSSAETIYLEEENKRTISLDGPNGGMDFDGYAYPRILLIEAYKYGDVGSLATYVYARSGGFQGKLAAMTSALSSTYGTISIETTYYRIKITATAGYYLLVYDLTSAYFPDMKVTDASCSVEFS